MKSARLSKILPFIAAMMFLFALGTMFLPVLMVTTYAGESISFFGWTILLGGQVEETLASGTYSFSFGANIPLLVTLQALLLSAVACLLSGGVPHRAFALLLGVASLVGLSLSKFFVLTATAIESNGLSLGYGLILAVVFTALGVLLQVVSMVLFLTKRCRLHKQSPSEDNPS